MYTPIKKQNQTWPQTILCIRANKSNLVNPFSFFSLMFFLSPSSKENSRIAFLSLSLSSFLCLFLCFLLYLHLCLSLCVSLSLSLSRSVLSRALSLCLSSSVSVSFSLPLSLSLLHFRRVAEQYRHPVYSRIFRLFIRAIPCGPFHIFAYIWEHTCVPPPLCIPGRFSS